jgi:thiamine kinase
MRMSERPASDLPLGRRIGEGRSAEVFPYGPDHVLKLYKTPSEPAAVANEFAAARQAYAIGLPVPKPVDMLERDGRAGILFARASGPVMHAAYIRKPLRYLLGLRRLALLQRDIHTHAAADLPHVREPLRQQIVQARVSSRAKQAALTVLDRLPDGDRLLHGDLHPDNVIVTPAGLQAIDWQKAGAGAPAADAARTALMLRYGSVELGRIGRFLPIGVIRTILAELYIGWYSEATGVKRAEIKAWLLPLLVSRLFGQRAGNEAEVRAAIERRAMQVTRVRSPGGRHGGSGADVASRFGWGAIRIDIRLSGLRCGMHLSLHIGPGSAATRTRSWKGRARSSGRPRKGGRGAGFGRA